ncbi:type II asparaginase [Halioglobus maricola]|uniref:Type II asparaginase n=1 Tax=Halioglobus maricola TaxID=2601894 RepID=A0A5P9NMY7_9GAMM|nr:type II asparaginase [Halioglobus maricola]QFU77233.1 type II asparaginase [Halioglobus maricola]
MKLHRLLAAAMLSTVAASIPAHAAKDISILATGGTIAGSADTQTQAGYTSGQVGVETLLAAVPQLKDLADISGEQVANVGSQDMNDAIWLDLAERVNTLLATKKTEGVVITHGTDTIEETAYFLNLVIDSDKPVVLTAAMRPSTALSADGPLNIYNAVAVAADIRAAGRGVLVVVNDDIHGARAVTKTNTTDVQTFLSPERGLIGTTLYGKNTFYRGPYRAHTSGAEFSLKGVKELPRVDILYMHANFSADIIDAAVANGAKGLVIAGVGNGNMTTDSQAAVARATKAGVAVVRSSRVFSGATGRNVETDDDTLGTVASGELNPAKARVLLQLALLKTKDAGKIQAMFDKY